MRRAQQQLVSFLCTNASGAPLTGLAFADGEVQLSKDGGAFVGLLGSRVTEIGLGYYSVTLTAAETRASCVIVAIRKTGVTASNDQYGALDPHPAAAVVSDPANSATTFVTDLTETADDFYAHAGVRFNSGALQGQVREIASYNGATKAITLAEPLTGIPAAGSLFELIDS